MKTLTFDGQAALLLDDLPDWSQGISAEMTRVSGSGVAVTGREERFSLALTSRWRVSLRLTLEGQPARTIERLLRDYRLEPVLLPFWPLQTRWNERSGLPISAGIHYVTDGARSEVYTTTEVAWPNECAIVAPALLGWIEKREFTWESANVARFDVEFIETSKSKYAMRSTIPRTAFPFGPFPSPKWPVRPIFAPFQPDFKSLESRINVRLDRDEVGFSRVPVQYAYNQNERFSVGLPIVSSSQLETATAIAFFETVDQVEAFWHPWPNSAVEIVAADAGSFALPVKDVGSVLVGDWLAIRYRELQWWSGQVVSINKDSIGVSVSLDPVRPLILQGQPLRAVPLRLARYDGNRMRFAFRTTAVATMDLPLVEVSDEYVAPDNEIANQTYGGLVRRAYLFDVRSSFGTDRVTSFESDLVFTPDAATGPKTYRSISIAHDDVAQGLALDRDILKLSIDLAAIDAFREMIAIRSEIPIWVTLYQATVNSDGTTTKTAVLFTGEASGASLQGSVVEVELMPGGTVFDRVVPRFRVKAECNYELFSKGCSLDPAKWTFSGEFAGPGKDGGNTVAISKVTRTDGTRPTFFDHWFAGGWIEIPTSGGRTLRRAILDSTTVSAAPESFVTLTLNSVPAPFPSTGLAVKILPGCDGRRETCLPYSSPGNPEGKFNNYDNFGGHPFIPLANPTLVQARKSSSGGKK